MEGRWMQLAQDKEKIINGMKAYSCVPSGRNARNDAGKAKA